MTNRINLIGHVTPDSDTVAADMGCAWLLRERDGSVSVAARTGAVNPKTVWALKKVGLDASLRGDCAILQQACVGCHCRDVNAHCEGNGQRRHETYRGGQLPLRHRPGRIH